MFCKFLKCLDVLLCFVFMLVLNSNRLLLVLYLCSLVIYFVGLKYCICELCNLVVINMFGYVCFLIWLYGEYDNI